MFYFILFLLITVFAAVALLDNDLNVLFGFDTRKGDTGIHIGWREPFFRSSVTMSGYKPFVTAYIFDKKVYAKTVTKRRYSSLHISGVKAEAFYSLDNPFTTIVSNGIIDGMLRPLMSAFPDMDLTQHPDLFSARQYLALNGSAKVNPGKTLVNIIRNKIFKNYATGEKKMDHISMTENIDSLFHSLENFTQKEGVIGKAVTQNEKTFMPVVSITVGYGGGNMAMGKNQNAPAPADSGSGAMGLGAKLCTDAIIVIDSQQNVSMLPVNGAGGQIAEKIPQIISSIKGGGQPQQPQPTA